MKTMAITLFSLIVVMLLTHGVPAAEGRVETTNCLQPTTTACVGDTETVEGIVVSAGQYSGLVINTGTTEEVVYGLGPEWYWDGNGVDRPDVGEIVTVRISHVKCMEKRVILEIWIGIENGDTSYLQLRDTFTCVPLWRGGR